MTWLSSSRILAVLLAVTASVAAQEPGGTPPSESSPASPAATTVDEAPGTVIIGDRESPIGLYLTPWKDEYAARNAGRPAQHLLESMEPIDPEAFHRQNTYYDVITAYRRAELAQHR